MFRFFSLVLCVLALCNLNACTKSSVSSGADDHAADHDHDHDHDHDGGHDPHDATIELGSSKLNDWVMQVARAESHFEPGDEVSVDVTLTGGKDNIAAVRAWIGSPTGEGSLKTMEEGQGLESPQHYHLHVEVPSQMADDSQLWIELELDFKVKLVGGFFLKR